MLILKSYLYLVVLYLNLINIDNGVNVLNKFYSYIGTVLALLMIFSSENSFAASLPAGSDPGVQLKKNQENELKQKMEDNIEKERKDLKDNIKDNQDKGENADINKAIKFRLNKIEIDKSEVLTEKELSTIISNYEGKEILINDLYKIVSEINSLYEKKGFIVCKAILPEQTIKKGIVKIILIEGRNGQVFIQGNQSTREDYIKNRLGIKHGEVSPISKLDKALVWFNGSNDVQLKVELKAGSERGTTDYYITAYEPVRQQTTTFFDNAGSESTGEWREGIVYNNASVTGNRDALSITTMRSKGSKSGAINYSMPINNIGTKFGASYSANSIEIIDGALANMDVRGHSEAWGFYLNQPTIVKQNLRQEVSFEMQKQNSKTDILGMHWVNDNIKDYTVALTQTSYQSKSALYQRHGYTIGNYGSEISHEQKDYGRYSFNGIYQYAFDKIHMLNFKLNGQIGANHYLPSAEQFYIGGMYSVRGYKENFLGADSGFSANLEYNIANGDKGQTILFMDGGGVFGDNAFKDHTAISLGVGYRANISKDVNSIVTIGFPLKRDYAGQEVDKVRINCFISGSFK